MFLRLRFIYRHISHIKNVYFMKQIILKFFLSVVRGEISFCGSVGLILSHPPPWDCVTRKRTNIDALSKLPIILFKHNTDDVECELFLLYLKNFLAFDITLYFSLYEICI